MQPTLQRWRGRLQYHGSKKARSTVRRLADAHDVAEALIPNAGTAAVMAVVPFTMHLPADLWHAVQAVALHDGDANTAILRALEEYITATRKRPARPRTGQYQKLVKQLSTPVVALKLCARPASTLKLLKLRYVYELVQKAATDFVRLPNLGEKSLREGEEKLATLGLTLGMTLDDDAHNTGVVAAVAANIKAARK